MIVIEVAWEFVFISLCKLGNTIHMYTGSIPKNPRYCESHFDTQCQCVAFIQASPVKT